MTHKQDAVAHSLADLDKLIPPVVQPTLSDSPVISDSSANDPQNPPAAFDLTQLFATKVGDQIELPGLFLGITDEPVLGEVIKVGAFSVAINFTYHGVRLATKSLTKSPATKKSKEKIEWL